MTKTRSVLAVAAAAVFLSACGTQGKPVAQSSESSAATVASTSSASASAAPSPVRTPATGEKPDRAFVVGKWGTDGDCLLAIDLRPDGTSDGPFGNWSYADGVITFADAPDLKVNVTVLDPNTMQSNNDGKMTKMTRCP